MEQVGSWKLVGQDHCSLDQLLLPATLCFSSPDPRNLGAARAREQRQVAGYRQASAAACIQPLRAGPEAAGSKVRPPKPAEEGEGRQRRGCGWGCSCPPTHRSSKSFRTLFPGGLRPTDWMCSRQWLQSGPAAPTAVQRPPSVAPGARMSGIAAGKGIPGPWTPKFHSHTPWSTASSPAHLPAGSAKSSTGRSMERLVSWQPRGTEPSEGCSC